MKYRNEAIDLLTEGYERVAQMSIKLAHDLEYTTKEDYAIVITVGDETSAGLPYFTDVTFKDGRFRFLSYDTQTIITVPPDFQVLVYQRKFVRVSDDTQIDMLEEFALQFPEGSLIRKFITYELVEWLRGNKSNPDIYGELLHMKDVSYRLEDHVYSLQSLYDDQFPY